MWKFNSDTKGAGVKKDWIQEGNVPVYLIGQEPDRVKFLLEMPDVQQYAKDNKVPVEEAEEILFTKVLWEKWIMPVPFWEHTIPAIPGERFFSTKICPGMQVCKLCSENNISKHNGVTENKMLPYPVRKRYIAPIYNLRLKKVLYLKQSQEFFEEIGAYIAKNGVDVEFDIYKVGKGFNTKYKAIFVGPSKIKEEATLKPLELDFEDGTEQPQPEPKKELEPKKGIDSVGDFVLSFGSHKGKSLQEIMDMGQSDYIEFLSTKSTGVVQEMAEKFLKEQS